MVGLSRRGILSFAAALVAGITAAALVAEDLPETLPEIPYHLTARPWSPLQIPKSAYLDAIEGLCRFSIRHQDERGAIIDLFLQREHQYSTPYFAFAVGALLHAGRAADLLPNGVRAMEHSTASFATGSEGIPDQHGEFFIAPLTGVLEFYEGRVPEETLTRWRERMRTPLRNVLEGFELHHNNWRTYAMKGEWMRYQAGLVPRAPTLNFIRDAWLKVTQRERIAHDKWNLYQDWSSDPNSHAVEAVGRGNLIALAADGYDGEFADEIWRLVERGTQTSLLFQDPTGQCPPNGRTDDHVFNDVLYQLAFEVLAERAAGRGDLDVAGQYRRAAMLSFGSIGRWRRTDPGWEDSYYITKNRFDPALRVGYQPASNYGNYSGATMMHLAEAFRARNSDIDERPAPTEIGGYALAASDPAFSSVVANAGGMQMFASMRGDGRLRYGVAWTALGVLRFARAGWDSRLGPSDGIYDVMRKRGVTFAPTWKEDGRWVRMASLPQRYEGKFEVKFVHPLLVRCAIEYKPKVGQLGPAFVHEFVITPDGVLAKLRSPDAREFGVTWPILEDDGKPLDVAYHSRIAAARYPGAGDEQNFLLVNGAGRIDASEAAVRSTYGWLRPVRATVEDRENATFVYPRDASDPPADAVLSSFELTPEGFRSVLSRVEGSIYVGRTAAGGVGPGIDIDGDGTLDVRLSETAGFVLQLERRRVTAAEADRDVEMTIGDAKYALKRHVPLTISN